jgi:hypothetical protein
LTIDGYRFREAFNHAEANSLILVAPSLGMGSTADILTDSAHGLDRYLDQVLAGIREHAPEQVAPGELTIDYLYVAAHSKGGQHLRKLIVGDNGGAPPLTRYQSALRQIWALDCLYDHGDADAWFRYCQRNPGVPMYVYWTLGIYGGTERESTALMSLAEHHKPWWPGDGRSSRYWGNVFGELSKFPHHWVPWWYLLVTTQKV